ncbi:Eukaryotic translation initiation factor 5B [Trichoplax sp. H2]|nr:Eukaryotic translation initiation factor 5B [Trichoplax sp. H2]|eukprot:RDD37781.1 Eukaryotic translation initiation factor 5B [Trichoplax sp. H2]
MAKSKKDKKKSAEQPKGADVENTIDIDEEGLAAAPVAKRNDKKGRKKKGQEYSDDELPMEVETPQNDKGRGKDLNPNDDKADAEADDASQNQNPGKKGAKSKGKKTKQKWDEEEPESEAQPKTQSKKKGKTHGEILDEDDLADLIKEMDLEDEKVAASKKSKGRSKKNKKKKEIDDYDDDLEEIKKEMGMATDTASVEEKPTREVNDENIETETTEKVKETTKTDNDEGVVIKSAAQKKAEKKERERLKKLADKEKQQKQKPKGKVTESKASESNEKAEVSADATTEQPTHGKPETGKKEEQPPAEKASSGSEDESDGEGKKKKKRKKKKKGEKDDASKTKKPTKAKIKLMQEALEQRRLQEESMKAAEEERIRKEEEAERLRLEKKRLEEEKRERKKQKEKERKERLKKEGKLLTKAQKQEKARIEARLESMRQQGFSVPDTGLEADEEKPKKRVVYGKKKKSNQNNAQSAQEQTDASVKESASVMKERQESVAIEGIKEEIAQDDNATAESWDKLDFEKVDDKDDTEAKVDEAIPQEAGKAPDVQSPVAESESEEESDEEESSSESSSSDSDDDATTAEGRRERALNRIQERRRKNEENRDPNKLRAPVICVLGHVDTGKTKILDKIRRTHVQDGEAGGITQQIGATKVPVEAIREQTKNIKEFATFDLKLPGLLIIDTPGHESFRYRIFLPDTCIVDWSRLLCLLSQSINEQFSTFSNLRNRGSSLCDIAILVIDLMHGLEPQTIESINLLKKRKTPFIVALNKVDRLFEWKKAPHTSVADALKKQKRNVKLEFDDRCRIAITALAEQGLNAALFHENQDPRKFVSLVPTSAITGDGMGDLIALIVKLSQTMLTTRLSYSNEIECSVMEVKALPGLGTTVDVVLTNGKLREGDTLVFSSFDGPVVTQARALLTTPPLKEIRVKEAIKKLKEQHKHLAIFPAKLRIAPQYIFNTRDPIVVGVRIEDGTIRSGTPLTALTKEHVDIGVVTSVEMNHKQIECGEKGQEVCIKIENIGGDAPKLYGRHFDATNLLVSKISRDSIDVLKNYFRDEMQKGDWLLVKELKKHFNII